MTSEELRARLDFEIRFDELVFGLLLEDAISWDDARDALFPADAMVRRFRERFNDEQLASIVHLIGSTRRGQGTAPQLEELLSLGVCGLNGDGEDLMALDADELQRRIAVTLRLEQSGRPSSWLAGYAKLLAAESRRRRAS